MKFHEIVIIISWNFIEISLVWNFKKFHYWNFTTLRRRKVRHTPRRLSIHPRPHKSFVPGTPAKLSVQAEFPKKCRGTRPTTRKWLVGLVWPLATESWFSRVHFWRKWPQRRTSEVQSKWGGPLGAVAGSRKTAPTPWPREWPPGLLCVVKIVIYMAKLANSLQCVSFNSKV